MEMSRICMILEGSYPYVRGGVSTWMHEYIKHDINSTYTLWTIHAVESDAGQFKYELPKNVIQVTEISLEKAYQIKGKRRCSHTPLIAEIIEAFRRILLEDDDSAWDVLFSKMNDSKLIVGIIASVDFLQLAELLSEHTESLGLSDAFYGLRSMLLPIMYLLVQKIPMARIYHSASAGYSGLIGAMAAFRTKHPFILTEHGIYPREREEELILADWIHPGLRDVWIKLFYNISRVAYRKACAVTSLFEDAMQYQISIGCDTKKCRIIPNGIPLDKFVCIPNPPDRKEIHIGAFVRFSPIKDIKTMLIAFHSAQQVLSHIHLHIMGEIDDTVYFEECKKVISMLHIQNLHIDGYVDTIHAMQEMNFTILSSISEGQPLTILESLAAGRPCIATNVGNCGAMLEKISNGERPRGICVPPMQIQSLCNAILRLANNSMLRSEMGESGRKWAVLHASQTEMMKQYQNLYKEIEK